MGGGVCGHSFNAGLLLETAGENFGVFFSSPGPESREDGSFCQGLGNFTIMVHR